ncbi:MAG: Dockerin type 1, partial [Parcubacteria group bacterium Athens1014_10]
PPFPIIPIAPPGGEPAKPLPVEPLLPIPYIPPVIPPVETPGAPEPIKIEFPEIKFPEIKFPEIEFPEIKFPDIKLPEISINKEFKKAWRGFKENIKDSADYFKKEFAQDFIPQLKELAKNPALAFKETFQDFKEAGKDLSKGFYWTTVRIAKGAGQNFSYFSSKFAFGLKKGWRLVVYRFQKTVYDSLAFLGRILEKTAKQFVLIIQKTIELVLNGGQKVFYAGKRGFYVLVNAKIAFQNAAAKFVFAIKNGAVKFVLEIKNGVIKLADNIRENVLLAVSNLKNAAQKIAVVFKFAPAGPEKEKPAPPVLVKTPSVPPEIIEPEKIILVSNYGDIKIKSVEKEKAVLIAGSQFKSFIKPAKQVKEIKAQLIFVKSLSLESVPTLSLRGDSRSNPAGIGMDTGSFGQSPAGVLPQDDNGGAMTKKERPLLAMMLGVPFAQAEELAINQALAKEWLVGEYVYTDSDGDGIYEADIQLPPVAGSFSLKTLIDYADGDKKILEIEILIDPEGYIYTQDKRGEIRLEDVVVTLYRYNEITNEFEIWPAEIYDQKNPQITDKTGQYSFLAPEGKYYLKVVKNGYEEYNSKRFEVLEGRPVNQNIELKVKRKFFWR